MVKDDIFQERVVRVEKPSGHFTLLRNADGDFLGVSDTNELATFDYTDDKAIWEQVKGTNAYRHVATGLHLEAEPADVENGCCLRHNGDQLTSDGSIGTESAVFLRWTRARTPAIRIPNIIQAKRMGLSAFHHRP